MSLLDLALLLCPREFREGYRRDFRDDAPSQAVNVAWVGIALRAESLARDAVFAVRSLAKSPVFTAIILLTLALALSVNAAVFSIIDTVLLRPLPFVQPARMMLVCGNTQNSWCMQLKNGEIGEIRRRATAFEGIAAYQDSSYTLTGFGVPQSLRAGWVSANYFKVLNVHPQLGRFFRLSDARPGVRNVVISYALWRDVFRSAPNIVGRAIVLDGNLWHVIGVAPPQATTPTAWGGKPGIHPLELWTALDEGSFARMQGLNDWAFARLRPGVSEAQANAQLARIANELAQQYPLLEKGLVLHGFLFPSFYYSGVRPLLYIALAAVFAVLLIACANIANLLLVRGLARQGELAVRNALGAARARIAQQLVVEICVLSLAGGAIGLLLAWFELKGAAALDPSSIVPDIDKAGIDVRVALFTFGIALVAALIAGVLPALFRGRSRAKSSVRSALGALQIALAFAVVIASILLYKSFMTITHSDIGMDGRNLYVAQVNLIAPRWDDPGARERFVERAIAQLAHIPGVQGAYATRPSFWGGNGPDLGEFRLPGQSYGSGTGPAATIAQITPGFLNALHVPLLRGRTIAARDTAVSQRVAVVEEHFVQRYFNGKNIIGTTILLPEGAHRTFVPVRIVGEVGTITQFGMMSTPVIYIPNTQFPTRLPEFFLAMRSPDPQLSTDVSRAIATVDPQQAVDVVYSEQAAIDSYSSPQRTSALLFSVLAAVALLLALAGIYGIMAYSVQQREHEIGVRMAIGARALDVLRNVLSGGMRLAVVGVAAGIVLAALAARWLSGMLYQTSVFDLLSFSIAIALLLVCVMLACSLPALRAAHIDPAKALRYE